MTKKLTKFLFIFIPFFFFHSGCATKQFTPSSELVEKVFPNQFRE
jgi:hypothetical protein